MVHLSHKKLGQYLRTAREAKGISRDELAERLHVTTDAIAKWERGERCPDFEMVINLSNELEVDLAELRDVSVAKPSSVVETVGPILLAVFLLGLVALAVFHGIMRGRRESVPITPPETTVEETTEPQETETETQPLPEENPLTLEKAIAIIQEEYEKGLASNKDTAAKLMRRIRHRFKEISLYPEEIEGSGFVYYYFKLNEEGTETLRVGDWDVAYNHEVIFSGDDPIFPAIIERALQKKNHPKEKQPYMTLELAKEVCANKSFHMAYFERNIDGLIRELADRVENGYERIEEGKKVICTFYLNETKTDRVEATRNGIVYIDETHGTTETLYQTSKEDIWSMGVCSDSHDDCLWWRSYEKATAEQKQKLEELQKRDKFSTCKHEKEIRTIMGEISADAPLLTVEKARELCRSIPKEEMDQQEDAREQSRLICQYLNQVAGTPETNNIGWCEYVYHTDTTTTIVVQWGTAWVRNGEGKVVEILYPYEGNDETIN